MIWLDVWGIGHRERENEDKKSCNICQTNICENVRSYRYLCHKWWREILYLFMVWKDRAECSTTSLVNILRLKLLVVVADEQVTIEAVIASIRALHFAHVNVYLAEHFWFIHSTSLVPTKNDNEEMRWVESLLSPSSHKNDLIAHMSERKMTIHQFSHNPICHLNLEGCERKSLYLECSMVLYMGHGTWDIGCWMDTPPLTLH